MEYVVHRSIVEDLSPHVDYEGVYGLSELERLDACGYGKHKCHRHGIC